MKRILKLSTLFSLLLTVAFMSCKKSDTLDPSIEGLAIDDYDIIQLTNESPDVPVYISYSDDRSIDSVAISIKPMNSTTPVARNVIRNFKHSSTGRTLVKTPFPFPGAGGPTGVYTIEYSITDRSGKQTTKAYNVNILNNRTQQVCTFPAMNLPAGKNVWIRVTSTQPISANENIYVTGSFEQANGGAGDWTGGNVATFKLNRVGNSNQCFYIALNLDNSQEFKFTLGTWDQEALGNSGQVPSNAKWNGQSTQDITIYNWKGKPLVNQTIPQVLPSEGINTGHVSIISDVNNSDDNIKYYLVPKGGNVNDKSRPMYRVMNGSAATTRVIGSVPKSTTTEYIVVRDNNGTIRKGVNNWGFEVATKWDGISNPISLNSPYFEGDAGIQVAPETLHIVGGATPNGWANPTNAAQTFTKSAPGKFEIASLKLTPGQAYLLLPRSGEWSPKYGGSGKLGGNIVVDGPDIPSPDAEGNYKITVDFTTGKYTLTKL